MRLKNKKTGQIIEKFPDRFVINSGEQIIQYNSLAELNAEWIDAPEEPKRFYWLDYNGDIYNTEIGTMDRSEIKEIGNYFETREEAELALRKLKAWKRLKDKGFRFDNWDLDADGEDVNVLLRSDKYKGNQVYVLEKDLDILFGGEE